MDSLCWHAIVWCMVVILYNSVHASDCTYSSSDGSWDLTYLTYNPEQAAPPGYVYSANNTEFYVNFCEQVSQVSAPECNEQYPAGACQYSSGDYMSLGTSLGWEFVDYVSDGNITEGIGLQYNYGAYCSKVSSTRNATIYVSCDITVDSGYLYQESEVDICNYKLYFKSKYGCPNVYVGTHTPTVTPGLPSSSPTPSPAPPPECSFSDGSDNWNLSPLAYDPNTASPYGYSFTSNKDTFYINFCAPVSTVSAPNCPSNSGACQITGLDVPYSMGEYETASYVPFTSPGSGLEVGMGLQYTDGTLCSDGTPRKTTINIACDPAFDPGFIISEYESSECEYVINFLSKYGCPI